MISGVSVYRWGHDGPMSLTTEPSTPAELDYLAHIATESVKFMAALTDTPCDVRVPTCPDWNAADLLWHLTSVQGFWGEIVASRAITPESAEASKPERAAEHSAALALFEQVTVRLSTVLADDPATPVWTWADDHSIGFVRRRQAHEALIHRVDAELVAEQLSPIDPQLAADGVDEVLGVMFSSPSWGTFTPDPARLLLRVETTDTANSWLVQLGRVTGIHPPTGTAVDGPTSVLIEAGESTAMLSGTAADLDCLPWNRPTVGVVERSGDPVTLAAFDVLIAEGMQ